MVRTPGGGEGGGSRDAEGSVSAKGHASHQPSLCLLDALLTAQHATRAERTLGLPCPPVRTPSLCTHTRTLTHTLARAAHTHSRLFGTD